MCQDERLNPTEQELAAALGSLAPAGVSIDRDELMFRAGLAAARRRLGFWQGTAGLLAAALAVSVGLALYARATPTERTRIVYVHADRPADAARVTEALARPEPAVLLANPGEGNYLMLRDEVLREGLAALPKPAAGPSSHDAFRAMRLLDARPGSAAARELGL